MIIPQNKQWIQRNSGEVFGNIYASKNLNFDQEGYLKLAHRPSALIHALTNFSEAQSIVYLTISGSPGYYIVTSSRLWRLDSILGTTVDLNGSNFVGGEKFDGVGWLGRWYVSQATYFKYYDASGIFATDFGTLTSGNYHPMCVFESSNYLAIGDGNTVKLYNTSHTNVATLTIPSDFEVRWIRYNDSKLYIGTKNISGGDARLFIWNGSGTAAQNSYPAQGSWMFSGVVFSSTIATITSAGQLLAFNGGGFTTLASLPVYFSSYTWSNSAGNPRVHHRGMVVDGEVIYLVIDGTVNNPDYNLQNQPSGLWVFDPKVGLYHKAGFAYSKKVAATISGADTGTDVLTVTSNSAPTGVPVLFSGTIGGLTSGNVYYLIRVTATTCKLATSYANAIAGTAVNITSYTSGTLYFNEGLDYGRTEQDYGGGFNVGAITLINDLDTTISTNKRITASQVLYGVGDVANNASSATADTLQTLCVGDNRGYFVTTKIFSQNVQDIWTNIYAKHNNLFTSADKVIVKYRTTDRFNYPLHFRASNITWSDADTFTTTSDLSSVQAGDEVEIVDGVGSGCLAHISSITESSGTYTVNLDETIPGVSASDKSGIYIQNWKKIGQVTTNDLFKVALDEHKQWIQLKVELRGLSEPYVSEINIKNKVDIPNN